MRRLLRPLLFALPALLAANLALAEDLCPPEGWDAARLGTLKAKGFELPVAAERQQLALSLLDCLSAADPALRDGVAFEAWSRWTRAGLLEPATLATALARLQDALDPARGDDAGFAQPFSALVLAEIARSDRLQPWLEPEQRAALVEAAAAYVESVRDYRGFIAGEGWRHGVAHGSDWLLQLALNPALDRKQADRLLEGVSSQVVPPVTHAYVFGEPGRLARPVLAIAHRGLLTPAEWETWLSAFAPRLGAEEKRYLDEAWLAKRHDLLAFLTALYLEADRSDDPQVQALEPAIVAGLKTVP